MRHSFFLVVLFFIFSSCSFIGNCGDHSSARIYPTQLTCEYIANPAVVDVNKPRLAWINISEQGERGQTQTAWQVRVSSSKYQLEKPDLWDSERVEGNQSTRVQYGGKTLTSGQDCWWQVRVWDKDGMLSEWSEPAFWRMGLLEPVHNLFINIATKANTTN